MKKITCIIIIPLFLSCSLRNEKNKMREDKSLTKKELVSLNKNLSASALRPSLEDFNIEVVRGNTTENLVTGILFVNNKLLGTTFENNELKINPGTYPGFLRYISQKGFVQGPDGYLGDVGDFLLEIGNVTWSNGSKRTSLLFHGGNKANQSQGCIMLGPVIKDANGNRILSPDHTLAKLRLEFYGTNNPISSPNKKILITIK